MYQRQTLSVLMGERITTITRDRGNGVEFRDKAGKVLFTVDADDLFDRNGYRFENDLPV
jgi:hypothetical protein